MIRAEAGLPTPAPATSLPGLLACQRLMSIWRRVREARAELHAGILPIGGERRLRAQVHGLARLFADFCALQSIRPVVHGPVPRSPVVLVANHVSYVDPIVLGALLPVLPLSKAELASWPLIGPLARSFGVVFVDRSTVMSGALGLRAASRALRSGLSVLNFPEGTTTRGESVLGFRRGIFGLAQRFGAPVVPVALRFDDEEMAWTGDASFLPHYLRSLARREIVVHVRFGSPLTPSCYRRPQDLAHEARAVVEHLLGEIGSPGW